MKKNKTLRIAMALLVVVAITTCGMTGALAKYIDEFSATGTAARAGLFLVVVEGADASGNFPIPLTIKDLYCEDPTLAQMGGSADFTTTGANTDYYVETHANPYDNLVPIIVPGSILRLVGSFKVLNYSEVDVEIAPDLDDPFTVIGSLLGETSDDLQFSVDGDTFGSTAVLLNAITNASGGSMVVPAKESATGVTFDVEFWVLWPFANDDTVGDSDDTIVGLMQAGALMNAAQPEVLTSYNKDCSVCTVGVECVAPTDTAGGHNPTTDITGSPYVPPSWKVTNDATTFGAYDIGFEVKITATQID